MMQTTGDRVSGKSAGEAAQAAKPMRVYELAKEVGLENKDLLSKARSLGIEAKNHMSSIEPEDVVRIRRSLDKERQDSTVTERLSGTVLRRRSKVSPEGAMTPAGRAATADDGGGHGDVSARGHEPPSGEEVEPPPPLSREEIRKRAAEEAAATRAELAAREAAAVLAAEAAAEARRYAEEDARQRHEAELGRRAAEEAARVAAKSGKPTPPPVSKATPAVTAPGLASDSNGETLVAAPVAEAVAAEAPEVVPAPVSTDRPLRKRTQFEEELERARDASIAKQAERAAAKASEPPPMAAAPAQVGGRPAVGSIIELPLPRIQITERGPGGRTLGRTTNSPPTNTMPGAGQVRGRFADSQRPGARKQDARGMGIKRPLPAGKKALKTSITTPADHKRVIKMEDSVSVSELAHGMGVKATEVLKKLWSMGMVGVTINASIDFDTAGLLAAEFGFEVQNVAFKETAALGEATDAPEDLFPRAPVVTVMGHVDHGKTSLLDAIRKTDVAAGESGGITQHIGAYRVSTAGAGDVVFLDTPGHAAFTAMRARGAQATDLVILVVAADDGVMPQTIEAINHAKDAKVPIIVAINKSDKPGANPDRVRQQVSEHGLIPEAWGGDTMYIEVSAYTKVGIDKLLEGIQLQAEVLELKANPKKLARGVIIEAKLDRNRGPMATVLIQEGTLRVGDIVVSGEAMGKVRAMLNDKGLPVTEAGPSMPVEVLGLDSVPEAGDVVNAVADEKNAKAVIENRRDARRQKQLGGQGKVSLENILEKIQEGQMKELKIILKTDVQGSAEALREALSKLSTDAVKVNVIQTGVGGITESDVNLAKAGGAVIVGFHVRPAGKASSLAEQEDVDIKLYDIIYEAIDDVKKAMVGLLPAIKREKPVGKIEVREVYSIPKIGTVAGAHVTEGKVSRQALVRVVRENVQVYTGKLGSLKRFKEDVREVASGYDCGLTIDAFQDLQVGDVIEAYEIVEEAATL